MQLIQYYNNSVASESPPILDRIIESASTTEDPIYLRAALFLKPPSKSEHERYETWRYNIAAVNTDTYILAMELSARDEYEIAHIAQATGFQSSIAGFHGNGNFKIIAVLDEYRERPLLQEYFQFFDEGVKLGITLLRRLNEQRSSEGELNELLTQVRIRTLECRFQTECTEHTYP